VTPAHLLRTEFNFGAGERLATGEYRA